MSSKLKVELEKPSADAVPMVRATGLVENIENE